MNRKGVSLPFSNWYWMECLQATASSLKTNRLPSYQPRLVGFVSSKRSEKSRVGVVWPDSASSTRTTMSLNFALAPPIGAALGSMYALCRTPRTQYHRGVG
jgi:hypothetical protein